MKHIKKISSIVATIEKSARRFIVVGFIGFCINFAVLSILYRLLKIDLLPAQLIAAECAILMNFIFHNNWTYKDAVKDSSIKRIFEFHASSWVGAGLTTVTLLTLVHYGVQYFFALVCGAVVALIWNFLWTRFIIWKPAESLYAGE